MRTIGERIRAFATYKYSKINDFADALSMGAPNVQAYMRGARKPGTAVLQLFLQLFIRKASLKTLIIIISPGGSELMGNRRFYTLNPSKKGTYICNLTKMILLLLIR